MPLPPPPQAGEGRGGGLSRRNVGILVITRRTLLQTTGAALMLPRTPAVAAAPATTPGMSVWGPVKYKPDFAHFDYVNPDAPKGGSVKYSAIGTFNSLNPFVINGELSAAGINLLFDTLAVASEDEPASIYGLAAGGIELASDKLSVLYTLRPQARFHDGTPMTPADVIWTFQTLREKGLPNYRSYYRDVAKVEVEGERGVRFHFASATNRELPQIIGQAPVLSKAYWSNLDFEATTLKPPVGSGPYTIESLNPGQSITYRRVADYWAKDLPVNRGRYNADTIHYDYYRDGTVALEAFKAGQYDIRLENVAKDWATGYQGPALSAGLIKKENIPNSLPSGMQAFGYNLRRPLFKDPRVRQALAYGFDFEWSNKALFYGAYTRTRSYFDNSDLAATGVPQGAELQLLQPFRGQLPAELFQKEYDPPKYDGSGDIRPGLIEAIKLLKAAGWTFKGETLVNAETGQPFEFEILLVNPQFERITLPFAQNLKRMGVTARVRTIDTSQYQKRMDDFDYDMSVVGFGESLTPGNEQRDYWGSHSADVKGSDNLLGIKSPVVDQLIEELVQSPDRPSLVIHTRALDRVLQWGFYVIPHYHLAAFRVAYWNKVRHPAVTPKYALDLDSWWIDTTAEKEIEAKKKEVAKPQ
jgi:microcin C transport system substrate-binding protein